MWNRQRRYSAIFQSLWEGELKSGQIANMHGLISPTPPPFSSTNLLAHPMLKNHSCFFLFCFFSEVHSPSSIAVVLSKVFLVSLTLSGIHFI